MVDLNVKINNFSLRNPILTASGTFGYGLEFQDLVPLEELGGVIVKGTTLERREETTTRAWPRRPRACSIAWVFRIKAWTISAKISILKSRISTRISLSM